MTPPSASPPPIPGQPGESAPSGPQSLQDLTCWVVTDGKAGMEIQCLGLAEAMGFTLDEVTAGGQVGALLLRPLPGVPVHHPIPMPDDPVAYARLLYASLHGLDDLGCDLILVDPPSRAPGWEGVRDRLSRAARGR